MLVLQVQLQVLDLTRVRDFNGGRLKGRLRPVRMAGDGKCMCMWENQRQELEVD